MNQVMGLDLSLSSAGVCVLRDGDWSKQPVTEALVWEPDKTEMTLTASGKSKTLTERQKIERLIWIANKVCHIVSREQVDAVYVEGYAFSRHSSSVTGLAELGGVVRVELLDRFDLVTRALTVSQCRRFVVGSAKVNKAQTQKWLAQQGLRFETDDEGDAFVVALTGWYLANPEARAALDVTRLEQIDAISKGVNRRKGRS